jgi:hypothetical protein
MSLRRNAGCDQRRRRVLIEENLAVAGTINRGGSKGTALEVSEPAGRAYSEAALAAAQPPAVAILAERPWTLAVVFLSALTAFVGLLAVYGQLALLPNAARPSELLALDVQSAGSLSRWLASLLLAAAAFQGVQIYRLRRHKTDDYRGRYRVWVWIPPVLFAIGACTATGLHRDIAFLSAQLIDPNEAAVHADMWPIGACILWSLVALRLGFELRDSRGSLALLALATLCYFGSATGQLIEIQPTNQLVHVMATTALANLGHLSLFLMVAVFGRRVYLESQGLLQQRTKRRKKIRASKDASEPNTGKKASKPTKKKAAPTSSESTTKPAEAEPDSAETADENVISMEKARSAKEAQETNGEATEDAATPRMSKAERRRQRKLQRRERRAA